MKKKSTRRSTASRCDEAVTATRDELKKLKTKVRRSVSEDSPADKSPEERSIDAREAQLKIARLEVKLSDVEKLQGAKRHNRWRKFRSELAAARRTLDDEET